MKTCLFLCILVIVSSLSDGSKVVNGLTSCERHNDCEETQWCYFSYDENHRPMQSGFCFSESSNTQSKISDIEETKDLVRFFFFLLFLKKTFHSYSHHTTTPQILLEEGSRAPDGAIKKFEPQGLKVSSLTVQAEEGKQAKVVLESGTGAPFSLRVSEDTFSVTKGEDLDVLTVNPDGDVVAKTKVLAAGSLSSDKGLIVNDVPQWTLAFAEDFSTSDGKFVSDNAEFAHGVTKCKNGLYMLGGFKSLSMQTVKKTYQDLPKHDRLMIRATYHFIDQWGGETGFMQMSVGKNSKMEYAWTETYDESDYTHTVDVCGSEVGEGRFSSPVEVSVPHTADVVTVAFGSTISATPAGSSGFYGVSSVEVYVRNFEA